MSLANPKKLRSPDSDHYVVINGDERSSDIWRIPRTPSAASLGGRTGRVLVLQGTVKVDSVLGHHTRGTFETYTGRCVGRRADLPSKLSLILTPKRLSSVRRGYRCLSCPRSKCG
jgi:hypothetical protein